MKMSLAGMVAGLALVTTVAALPAHATTINVAPIYGSASASSQTFGAASLAIDNNLDTNNNFFESGGDIKPYWTLDLGRDFGLSSLSIYQRTSESPRLLNNFTVTVTDSFGNVTFTNTYSPTGGGVPTPFDINFSSVIQGKTVQVMLQNSEMDFLALTEVQAYSDVPEPASLALLAIGLAGVAGARGSFRMRRAA